MPHMRKRRRRSQRVVQILPPHFTVKKKIFATSHSLTYYDALGRRGAPKYCNHYDDVRAFLKLHILEPRCRARCG
ncbi:hypothetical protein V5799_017321 [Amblyomma americanum]|uniref:Uncharacterized protein n=1 Tax=Amblyomma americanum TaxID=6943 RepID=A0AAQ4F2L2_AMBAM